MRIHPFFVFFPLILDDNLHPHDQLNGTLGHCYVCTKLTVRNSGGKRRSRCYTPSETKYSLFCSVIFVMCLGAFIEQYWLSSD